MICGVVDWSSWEPATGSQVAATGRPPLQERERERESAGRSVFPRTAIGSETPPTGLDDPWRKETVSARKRASGRPDGAFFSRVGRHSCWEGCKPCPCSADPLLLPRLLERFPYALPTEEDLLAGEPADALPRFLGRRSPRKTRPYALTHLFIFFQKSLNVISPLKNNLKYVNSFYGVQTTAPKWGSRAPFLRPSL